MSNDPRTDALLALADLQTAIDLHDADVSPLAPPLRMPAIRLALSLAEAGLWLREEANRAHVESCECPWCAGLRAYDARVLTALEGG